MERVRLRGKTSDTKDFSYGRYSPENRKFLIENDGKEFEAINHNMNYVRLMPSGHIVHIYECVSIDVVTPHTLQLTDREYAMVWALLGLTTSGDGSRLYYEMKRGMGKLPRVELEVKDQLTGNVVQNPSIAIK